MLCLSINAVTLFSIILSIILDILEVSDNGPYFGIFVLHPALNIEVIIEYLNESDRLPVSKFCWL